MMWINMLGGPAVLGSYAHGLWTHPATGSALWGGVPEEIRPFYAAGILFAASGYFAFTYFLFFRLDPEKARIANRFGFSIFNGLYAAVLIPSALWMPLSFAMLAQPSGILWWAIRMVLGAVALASVGLAGALLTLRPRKPAWAYWLAVAGSIVFSIQTALLDALIWPAFFPV